MDWILEHIQVIILIAGSIAYYLNQRRREKEGLPADYDEDGVPDTRPVAREQGYDPASMEAEEAERTRRLQEELRQKRALREGGAQPPPVPTQTTRPVVPGIPADPMAEVMREITRRIAEARREPTPEAKPAPEPALIDQGALTRQIELRERMEQLERDRKDNLRRAEQLRAENVDTLADAQAAQTPGNLWRQAMGSKETLRRAIVSAEILGKPVALR